MIMYTFARIQVPPKSLISHFCSVGEPLAWAFPWPKGLWPALSHCSFSHGCITPLKHPHNSPIFNMNNYFITIANIIYTHIANIINLITNIILYLNIPTLFNNSQLQTILRSYSTSSQTANTKPINPNYTRNYHQHLIS